jgi:hypothetical protein
MEDVYKALPIALSVFFGAGALMFTAAKATAEETQRVKVWIAQIIWLLWLCVALSWSVYHCISFGISDAPINRPEVALFGMHLINATLYSSTVVFHIRKRLQASRKKEIAALKEKQKKMEEELLAARIKADVAEQLVRFAEMLNGHIPAEKP